MLDQCDVRLTGLLPYPFLSILFLDCAFVHQAHDQAKIKGRMPRTTEYLIMAYNCSIFGLIGWQRFV